ncbi:MAG: NAD(P)/FAD-dependent oxidoreductase [Flavobacteriales bacterium]
MMEQEKVDVLVIGAGPAGTVAAATLKQQGMNVRIVEKQQFPRFVIGESLLPRSIDHFEEVGLLDALKKQGFQTKHGAKFLKGDRACDFDFSEKFTDGREWAWQVPRADFDKALADEVERKGVPIDYQWGVSDVCFEGSDSRTIVENEKGEKKEIHARKIVDASGYGRVLPRLLGLDQPSDFSPRTAMFTHLKEPERPEGEVEERIFLIAHTKDVWIWVIPFSNGITSVGFVGDPEFFERFEGSPEERFTAMIHQDENVRCRFSKPAFVFTPKQIHAYSVSVKKLYGEGFVLTGNSTEFLDPIFSSGITFATETASVAGKLIGREMQGEKVDWEKEFKEHVLQGVDTFRTFVERWYDGTLQNIFFAPHVEMNVKKRISSVLAGYVWDLENTYVKNPDRSLKTLERVIEIEGQHGEE